MNTLVATYFLPLNAHPLFFVTVAYIIGIWISPPLIYCHLSMISAALYLGWLVYHKHYANSTITIATIFIIAAAFGSVRLHYVRDKYDYFCKAIEQDSFDMQGVITSIDAAEHPLFKQCMHITATSITHCSTQKALPINHETIFQLYSKATPSLRVGDTIRVYQLVVKPSNKSSFQDYLIKQGTAASLFLDSMRYTLVNRPAHSIRRWLFYKRQHTYEALRGAMSSGTFQLFSLIFLGKRAANKQPTERIKQHFTTWGVTHYLARSGLHMIIFVLIWQIMLNFLPLRYLYKQLILLVLSIIYCLFTWHSVSFYRAFIQCILYKICSISFTHAHVLHILTITCLAVLINSPMQLFFLDFQLSFGLTFALAWFNQFRAQRYKRESHQSLASD